MTEELIYWRHPTVPGIKVEEISGGNGLSAKLWLEMARQLYCENGKNDYREIGHFRNGAPFLYEDASRISISHCPGLLVVATLAPTPDIELGHFNPVTALGIDAERRDRRQVLNIRERFLSENEKNAINPEDIELNILAWTTKEAVYKACLGEIQDFQNQIEILRLPVPGPPTPVYNPKEFGMNNIPHKLPEKFFGEALITINNDNNNNEICFKADKKENNFIKFTLYSYLSDDFIITLAYTPDSSRFGKSN